VDLPGDVEIVELRADETHALRRVVLRDGTSSDQVVFDGDELPTTVHLGAVRGPDRHEIVAVSTWLERRYPDLPAMPAHQLRGMATDPRVRGTGVGDALVRAGVERCRAAGSQIVWARARVSALGFYVRHGFEPVGPEYVDLTTGLPHCDIVLRLDRA
jgi:GNAT superfamily N-acetyltransferase